MRYDICLSGKIPAKKGHYRSRAGGGLYIDSKTKLEMERLAMQIPGQLRDLKLQHPSLDVWFTVPKNSKHEKAEESDRDSKLTVLLDMLRDYGCIIDDDIHHFNGTMTIHPATVADHHYTKITLETK